MPSLIVAWYAVFGCYLWKICSFLKGNEERVDLWDREGGVGEGKLWPRLVKRKGK